MIKKSVSLTAEGKKELEEELDELIKNRPAVAERIATARAFGDLSENEEYSSARNEQKVAEGRILEIQDILKNAKVIRSGKKDKVSLGVTVVLDMGGRKVEYILVGPTEANPLEGKISNESPIGKAIFGRKAGESFEFNSKKVKIVEIK
ncbi:transcription elongation factor GreA [Candidatus Nanosyncoccus alces]|uniref:Transcription elongation factor GreA n=1 Tax=Candidatus Nanosyncoccus alces TaxID=2171997 RepID=A0ABY0FNT8_9BACT|nr:transcription elongation factor GreA [Candidatus Nanosyncoccus alces]RYC74530.1 Transcription elongation factor GreA [Candidatus Nanosyncoccus alces]